VCAKEGGIAICFATFVPIFVSIRIMATLRTIIFHCLLPTFLVVFGILRANATHIYGGDLVYQHLGNNVYQVTLTVYRDCDPSTNVNGTGFDPIVSIGIFNAGNNSFVQELSIPLSNSDIETLDLALQNPCFTVPPNVCVERAVYQANVTLPFTATGYVLTYQRCCRNLSIDNLNQSQQNLSGMTLTTQIPGTSLVAVQNSSPAFVSTPPTALCLNAPFIYSSEAIDPDGDELVYSFCTPLDGADQNNPAPAPPAAPPYTNNTWSPGFSTNYPITSNPAFQINPSTGLVTGTATQIGTYALAICVEEYRNGVLINTIRRDYQFNVNMCNPNTGANPGIANTGNGQQTDFCSGLEVGFVNNSINADSYHWDFGVPSLSNDTSNVFEPTFIYNDPGVYTVTLVTNPGWECADTATVVYTAIETFIPDIQTPVVSCINDQVLYTFDHGLVSGLFTDDVTFQWSIDNNVSTVFSTNEYPTNIYLDSNITTYNISLSINNAGCIGTQNFSFDNVPEPIAIIDPQTDPCGGFTINFTQSSINADNYLWNFGTPNSPTSTDAATFYNYPNSGSFNVMLIAGAPSTCPDTAYTTVSVFDDLNPDFINPGPVCFNGHNLAFTALGWNQPNAVINWDFGTLANTPNSSNITVNGIQYPSPAYYPVTLTISENGCTESITKDVWVVQDPEVSFSVLPPDGCPGTYVKFDATAISETPVFFIWNLGDDITSTQPDPLQLYENPGTFDVSMHAYTTSGCVADIYVNLNDAVTIHPAPTSGFLIQPDIITIDDPTVMVLDSTGTGISCTYQFSDGGTLEGFDGTYTFTEFGRQSITQIITNEFGCTSTAIGYINIGGTVFFLPNSFTPDYDGINDAWLPSAIGVAEYNVRIYDRWGELIFESNDVSEPWMGNRKGSQYFVQDGIYNYVITYEDLIGQTTQLKGNIILAR
jgi:gliding motility-associated-like protein